MGVYIPGMELPKEEPIIVKICPDGDVCGVRGGIIAKAIPVPPHGRLGDLDALADVFRSFIAVYDSCPFSQLGIADKSRKDELQAALAEVINSPTIIPAEEART